MCLRRAQEMDPEHDDEALASHFDRMNDYTDARTAVGELAGDELYEYIKRSGDAVVSFSHFLPRCVLSIARVLRPFITHSSRRVMPATVGPCVEPGRGG
jgi:hypothetical protein